MVRSRPGQRTSAGFTLEEACLLRRAVVRRALAIPCPECRGSITPTIGAAGDQLVVLIRCDGCGRGLVIQVSPNELTPL